ncbi:MAG: hypothetical protein AB7I42_22820 [Bradyrhizobium sp.]|uniref:DUF6197 family protein n=1 Tax=Bradyrhizobium sp. TaxID=376 RepID=UPI003D126E52
MTPVERAAAVATLRDAAALVERGWTQGAWARNAAGNGVFYDAPDAVRWCAIGAIWADDKDRRWGALLALGRHVGIEVSAWNDLPGRTADEVLAALRDCADRVERGEL